MGLRSALVDRGRVVERVQADRKVEGRTIYADVTGEWFRCRLQLPSANQTPDASTGARRVVTEPMLLFGVRDLEGDPLALNVEHRVEVVSKQLGSMLWDVQADPEPLRKKRKVIGFQVTLRRVVVHEAQVA